MRNVLVVETERRWAWIRLLLGLAQMFGAVLSVTLLVLTGVTSAALTVVAVTGLLTTVSVVLFGGRWSAVEGQPRAFMSVLIAFPWPGLSSLRRSR